MLEALLTDLLATHEVHIITTRDARLPPLALPVSVMEVSNDPWSLWQRCIKNADLVWLIAPETDGMLEKMTSLVPPAKLIGCTQQAVSVAASKYATAQTLAALRIPVGQYLESGTGAQRLTALCGRNRTLVRAVQIRVASTVLRNAENGCRTAAPHRMSFSLFSRVLQPASPCCAIKAKPGC